MDVHRMLISISRTSGVETARSVAHVQAQLLGYQQKRKGRCTVSLAVVVKS